MSLSVHGGYSYHNGYSTLGYNSTPEYYHNQYTAQPRYDQSSDSYMSWMVNPGHAIQDATPIDCSGSYGTTVNQAQICGLRQYEFYNDVLQYRGVKRRVTANKKERRRTESINTAFAQLRGCIPNVPSDTKLSKIKTLRLATSYISYLMDLLAKDDPILENAFKADIHRKRERRCDPDDIIQQIKVQSHTQQSENDSILSATSPTTLQCHSQASNQSHATSDSPDSSSDGERRSKGRTGWPQTVWASELR